MICWLIYDIKEDRARTRVHKYCKQAGLLAVQYSTFVGTLDKHERDSLDLRILDEIDEETDKVYIFPVSRDSLRDTIIRGKGFDEDWVTNDIKELFA